MAISINHQTYVISIPKNDLTLLQSFPTEIREMDINWFRLQLKSLEDDPQGIVLPTTHNHYPTVSLGGVVLARVVEILYPYTISFEDGQYAVNLTGANSNVSDRTNVNQVSIRSANSAGLAQSTSIDYTVLRSGIAEAVWDKNKDTMIPDSIGWFITKTLLTVKKFIGLK
jgi:hypothetical protein